MTEDEARGIVLQDLWRQELRQLGDMDLAVEREYCERWLQMTRKAPEAFGDSMVPPEIWEHLYGERLAWLQSEVDRRMRVATDYRSVDTGFTREYVDDVKNRIDLPEFVHAYYPDVGLKAYAGGSGWIGRCPFHDDRHPSFAVWTKPEDHWFCFTCLEGGDVFNLLLKEHARTFRDAVLQAADYIGMARPKPTYPGAVALE